MVEISEEAQAAQIQAAHEEAQKSYEEYKDDLNDAQADIYELTLALFPSVEGAVNEESEAFFKTPREDLAGITPNRLIEVGAAHILADYMSDIFIGEITL